jgi:hypothetical protein
LKLGERNFALRADDLEFAVSHRHHDIIMVVAVIAGGSAPGEPFSWLIFSSAAIAVPASVRAAADAAAIMKLRNMARLPILPCIRRRSNHRTRHWQRKATFGRSPACRSLNEAAATAARVRRRSSAFESVRVRRSRRASNNSRFSSVTSLAIAARSMRASQSSHSFAWASAKL